MSLMDVPIPARMAKDVPICAAVEALIAAKIAANCRPYYVKSLRSYLRQFAHEREQIPISSFDVFSIEQWFSGRNESMTTRASNTGRLSALFGFCERRGWIDRNPCRMLERPRIERKPPQILSAAQANKLIAAAAEKRPHMVPFFALSMLAGIRPDELCRIGWPCIDLERQIAVIDAAASKVRRRRIVELHPKAVRLLRLGGRLPVSRPTRRRYLSFACAVLGFVDWPQDMLRHTAASQNLALHRDAGRVAMNLGNSPGILMRHYSQLVSQEDCEAFWRI